MHHNWRKPACSNEDPLYPNGQESACSAGDPDSIPGSRNPLEKEMATHSSTPAWEIPPMAEGAWQATVHIVTKSWAWLSDFTFTLSNKQTETKSKGALFLIFGKLILSMEEKNHHSPPLFHSGPNSQKEPWSYSRTSLVYRMKSGTLVEVYSVFGRSCSCCSFRLVFLLQLLVITSVCQKLPRVQQASEVGN